MTYTAIYASTDLGSMIIDIVGALFNGVVVNAGLLVTLIILGIIVVLATDLLTGVFGIFHFLKGRGKR